MACGLMMKIDTSPSPGGLQVDHGGFRGKLPGAIGPVAHHVDVHAEEFFEVEHESGHIENGSVRGEGARRSKSLPAASLPLAMLPKTRTALAPPWLASSSTRFRSRASTRDGRSTVATRMRARVSGRG